MKKLFPVFLIAAAALLAEGGTVNLGTLSALGASAPVRLQRANHKHTIQIVVTGGPATCSVQLEGSLDDPAKETMTWANVSGAQTCTATTTVFTIDKPVTAIRANLTILTGGATPTVTVKYVGVQ